MIMLGALFSRMNTPPGSAAARLAALYSTPDGHANAASNYRIFVLMLLVASRDYYLDRVYVANHSHDLFSAPTKPDQFLIGLILHYSNHYISYRREQDAILFDTESDGPSVISEQDLRSDASRCYSALFAPLVSVNIRTYIRSGRLIAAFVFHSMWTCIHAICIC
jgi:hypothetical protein